jgi:hypothetical protein
MICLTGDIHHSSLGTGNQRCCDLREVEVAVRYLRMLEEAQVNVTFFISGRTFLEEWPYLRPICESERVEIGGHNFSCFTPALFHRVSKKLIGSYNGPAWYERRDAQATAAIIRARAGRSIRAWRNHMYMHGPNTEAVLASCGIRVCSDGVKAASRGPERHEAGIYNFPLNVIPDHEHLYHAERTPEWVAKWQKRYRWSDDFGSASYYVEEWTDIVLDGLRRNEERGAISNMIIHPITLYLCDGFKSFRRILDFLEARRTIFMSDALPAPT